MVGETNGKRPALLMPSATHTRAQAAFESWSPRGYDFFLWKDAGSDWTVTGASHVMSGEWRGPWYAVNQLAAVAYERGYTTFLYAGDDHFPDKAHTGPEIAEQFLSKYPDGWGVLQPTGDRQGVDRQGVQAAARICGSPWFGRAWVKHAYSGKGPTLDDYFFFYADEDLKCYAEKLGVLWQREDLIQDHAHWSWGRAKRQAYHVSNQRHWDTDKALFMERKKRGFP